MRKLNDKTMAKANNAADESKRARQPTALLHALKSNCVRRRTDVGSTRRHSDSVLAGSASGQ